MYGRTRGHFLENDFIGGIHSVDSIDDVQEVSDKMLGKRYVNELTGKEGYVCTNVFIQEHLDIAKEIYLKLDLD